MSDDRSSERLLVEAFLAAWGGAGFPKVVKPHLDAFFAGRTEQAPVRHPAGCVVRQSGGPSPPTGLGGPTCCYLADGTKVVLKRSPKGRNRGAVWLGVEEQAKIGLAEARPKDPRSVGRLPQCKLCDVCAGMLRAALAEPDLAAQMAADPEFVRRAEEGWKAIDEGRCAPLDEVKKKLDPP